MMMTQNSDHGDALDGDLPIDADTFWRLEGVDDLHFDVSPPEIEMEAVRLLEDPTFVGDDRFLARLQRIYALVTNKAIDVAYED